MKPTFHTLCILLSIMAQIVNAAEFKEEEMRIRNTMDSVTLAGTLTTPAAGEPKGVLVLASGSGAQNRDEEIMGHRPFKVIAEYLSTNGYAVLRMDDRGTGDSEGDFTWAVTDDFVKDISAGLTEMRHRYPQLPLGVLGHSEGGTVAIKEAAGNSDCDFIITLGAPAWSGDSIIMSQSRALAVGLTGRWDGEASQREILKIVQSDLPDIQARMALTLLITQAYGANANLPGMQTAIGKQVDVLLSPWYRTMVKYDPEADIRAVRKPWLAINGERDTQVLPANLATIRELNPTAETVELPAHNHLLQPCITGLVNEYATLPAAPSSDALALILRWLTATPLPHP